jgi:hypothetical protein
LNAGGLIAVGIAVGCAVALVVLTVRRRRTLGDPESSGPRADIAWPDPETRPRF